MYKLDVNVDYDDLESYQRAILSVVGLSVYGDEVVPILEAAYAQVCTRPTEESFLFLFSYDNFQTTHTEIVKWHNTGTCSL